MGKYKRPLTDILQEVIDGMNFNIKVLSVTDNAGKSQTLFCCDIFHAQNLFKVKINNLVYKIISFSQVEESITVEPTFVGTNPTITAGTVFSLYKLYFFHGTPIATNTELGQNKNASTKTPMIWLWENFKEKITEDEIIERSVPVELYALTQPPIQMAKMTEDMLASECSDPMQRLIENVMQEIKRRDDLFDGDYLKYDFEIFRKFGVMARNQGATKAVMMDNLSGVAGYTTLDLWYKDACECPVIKTNNGIGSMIVGSTFIIG